MIIVSQHEALVVVNYDYITMGSENGTMVHICAKKLCRDKELLQFEWELRLGEYPSKERAMDVQEDIIKALESGQKVFRMPEA